MRAHLSRLVGNKGNVTNVTYGKCKCGLPPYYVMEYIFSWLHIIIIINAIYYY